MERGLEKIEPVTATTYRTMRLNKTSLREWLKMANSEEVSITKFDSFASTSFDRSIVEKFAADHEGRKKNETDILLVIKGKSGRPIEGLSQFGTLDNGLPNQREVVFIRGKKFRVLSHMKLQNSPCGYEFLLEEV